MKVGEYYFKDDGGYPQKMWSVWYVDEELGDDLWNLTSWSNFSFVELLKAGLKIQIINPAQP